MLFHLSILARMLISSSFRPLCLLFFVVLLMLCTITARGQISFPASLVGYNYVGSAARNSNSIILTPTGISQVGGVWYNQKQSVANGFVTRFQFKIAAKGGTFDVNGLNGADGIAFVIQNSSETAIGLSGDGKGYADIPQCLAIEFDTFDNGYPEDPPFSYHISVQTRWMKPNTASVQHSLGWAPAPKIDDGKVHTAIIEYQSNILKVYVDTCSFPLLQIPIDIQSNLKLLNGKAWVGLTAATASSFQLHEILQWKFNPAGITVMDSGMCGKDSMILSAPSGYASYQWSTGEKTQQIICRDSGWYSVTCQGFPQIEVACNVIPRTFTTHVRLLPPVAAIKLTTDKHLPLCPGDQTIIQASSEDTSMRFQWEHQPWNSPTIKALEPGTYRVTGINEHGCVATDSIVIDTLKINITIRGATGLCNGDTITLEANTGFASYRWSNGALTRSIRVWKPGQYSVTAARADGCTVTSKELAVESSISTPTITLSGTSPFCEGDSLTLDAGAGYASYRWSTGEQTQKIIVRNGGSYAVEVTNQAGCNGYDTIVVTMLPLPLVDAGMDTTICAGDSLQLHGLADGLLLWDVSPSLSCFDCPSPMATPQQTTTYYLQAIGSNRCTARDSVTVTVVPFVAATVSSDTAICAGTSVQLLASGGTDIQWVPANGLSCADCPTPIATPTATTTYRAVVSNGGRCADTASITVTVVPLPEIQASNDTTICFGGEAMLRAVGAGQIRWQPSTGLSCTDCPNPVAAPTTTTRYVAVATNTLGCIASDSLTVTVTPLPTVKAGSDQAICKGESVGLEANGTGQFRWWPREGLSCADCPNPIAAPIITTTYRVTAANQYGCAASDSVTVWVNTAPRILQTTIGANLHGRLGGSIRVPVLLHQDIAAMQATSVRVSLRYDTTIMRLTHPTTAELQSATNGTLLEGWTLTVEAAEADSLRLFAEAPRGKTLAGIGAVVAPEFTLFLGNTTQARVAATVTIPDAPCTQSLPGSGVVAVDSLCGLNLRLIELSVNSFSLQQNHPNPFNPLTSLPFSLGLDGHVTAQILDESGRVVARLLDQPMQHGRYTIDWDATGYPSGIYYFRIKSGDWQQSIAMMLVK